MNEESAVKLAISLPRFDGPFDVLLALIRQNEYPIENLPIVEITSQFLAYVRSARQLDMALGGEFMEVGSWLVLLKSRTMLPREVSAGSATPQEELRQAVIDFETLAKAKGILTELFGGKTHVYAAGGDQEAIDPEIESTPQTTAEDIAKKFREAAANMRAASSFNDREEISKTVAEQVEWVQQQLSRFPAIKAVSTASWFEEQPDIGSRATLFLALLEMARLGEILVHQEGEAEAIRVKSLRQFPALPMDVILSRHTPLEAIQLG